MKNNNPILPNSNLQTLLWKVVSPPIVEIREEVFLPPARQSTEHRIT
jgi:hypothetical protein